MSVIRPVDRWFVEEVLPHERELLERAKRLCVDGDEAHDLVQEVLMRMLSTEAWSAITNPKAYMVRMMRNLAVDRLRRSKIVEFRHIVDLEDFDIPDDAPDQHRIVEDRQRLADVSCALDTLPERCRTVFVRCRIEGQSPRRIAEELGLSLSTLEKRLARAIYLLTQALELRYGDPSDTPRQEQRDHRQLGSRSSR